MLCTDMFYFILFCLFFFFMAGNHPFIDSMPSNGTWPVVWKPLFQVALQTDYSISYFIHSLFFSIAPFFALNLCVSFTWDSKVLSYPLLALSNPLLNKAGLFL